MKIIEQSHEILFLSDEPLAKIELAGRTCYKSEDKITQDSAEKFVKMLKNRNHHAMLEFGWMMVRFITNRGVTHELVRHRLCSFAQESTRYVDYQEEMEFIKPVWCNLKLDETQNYHFDEWCFIQACSEAEGRYKELRDVGWRPEQAREVLPNSLKTEIVVGANLREWMHIFNLRCSPKAHPQMKALMIPLRDEVRKIIPILFDTEGEIKNV